MPFSRAEKRASFENLSIIGSRIHEAMKERSSIEALKSSKARSLSPKTAWHPREYRVTGQLQGLLDGLTRLRFKPSQRETRASSRKRSH